MLTRMVFEQCFALKPEESVLIVADQGKLKEANLLFDAAKEISSSVSTVLVDGMTENAQEPSKGIVEKLCDADVALLVTTFSLTHTKGRKKASEQGTRIASLPGITEEMMVRTLSADYSSIEKESNRLAAILTNGKSVCLTGPGGTDLRLSIEGRTGIADTGKLDVPGAFGNLPAGEAFLAPMEGTTNGVLVVDGCLADVILDAPVEIQIKDGKVIAIKGNQAARDLEAAMQLVGDGARIVAELGIGTNENSRVDSDVLEAEKVFGTCHIAFGNNAGFGGVNDVPFHTDGVICNPTLICDGVPILKDGVFL